MPGVGIHLEDIEFTYRGGGTRPPFALHCPSLSVLPGQLGCLVGANASGKTTLIRICRGDLQATRGRVFIGGIEACDSRSRRRIRHTIATIDAASRDALVDELLVIDHMVAALSLAGRVDGAFPRSAKMIRSVVAILTEEGLGSLTSILLSQVGTLNAGHRQLVALALALLHDRPIMLADETTANLDISNAEMFFQEIRSRANAHNRLALVVTHDLFLAGRHADVIYVITAGVVQRAELTATNGLARMDAIAKLVLGGQVSGSPPLDIDAHGA